MKQLRATGVMFSLTLILGGCYSMPSLQGSLSALDFNLNATSYIVRAGESGKTIAFRHRMTEQQLASLNPGVDLKNLRPRQLINIRQPLAVSNRRVASAQASGNVSEYARIDGELSAPGNRRYDEVVSYPVQREEPQVLVGTPVSDQTLLGREPDYARALPPMRVGTFTENGYPVEEVFGENYQIPGYEEPVAQAQVTERPGLINEQAVTGAWNWPTKGVVTRGYDASRGIDIAGLVGQDVFAVSDGEVIFAGRDPSNVGKVVIIKHDREYISVYSHTKDLYVSTKDKVKAGDPVASLGPNPNEESMLRFELRRAGEPQDPLKILPPI